MREISALPAPGRATLGGEVWRWLRRPHQFTLTPLGGLVAAAALTVGFLLYRMASTPPAPPQGESRLSIRPGRSPRHARGARRRLQRLGCDAYADATDRTRGALDGGGAARTRPLSLRLLR